MPDIRVVEGVAIRAISAGTEQAVRGTVVFSNSNSVSFGMNLSTITASFGGGGAAAASLLVYGNRPGAISSGSEVLTFSAVYNSIYIVPMTPGGYIGSSFPGVMTASSVLLPMFLVNNGSSSHTISFNLGFYTLTGRTLSLLNSGVSTWTADAQTDFYTGIRYLVMASSLFSASLSFSSTMYWCVFLPRSTGSGAPNLTHQGVRARNAGGRAGTLGGASSSHTTQGWFPFARGAWSATSVSLPSSIALSDVNRTLNLVGQAIVYLDALGVGANW